MRTHRFLHIGIGILASSTLLPLSGRAASCYINYRVAEGQSGHCVAEVGACQPIPPAIRCPTVPCEGTRGCPGYQTPVASPPTPVEARGEAVEERVEFQQVEPRLQISIPGFPKFSDIEARRIGGGREVVSIPWIGEYLAAIYHWAVPVGAILATVVIMAAGIIWLTSGGAGQLSTAREWIGNAVIGLVLLVGSYVVLNLINPDLVRFHAIQIEVAQRVALAAEEETEPEEVTGQAPTPGGIVAAEGENIIGNSLIDSTLLGSLKVAALALKVAGYQLAVRSSYRTVADQERLIRRNCQNAPGSSRCDPKPDRPATCILRRGPESCPHTTGRAIDAWGARSGRQCLSQKQCQADLAACRANPCQAALIRTMQGAGFCNLASEPWHFEKPKMSATCA